MNLLDQLLAWFRGPATPAQIQTAPTIGDQLWRIALNYANAKASEAQNKANVVNAAAPADNAPGATRQASEAPPGQTLADLIKSFK